MSSEPSQTSPAPPARPTPPGPPSQPSQPSPPSPPSPSRSAADAFDRIRALGIVRPDQGRWVAGVATGLARRWGVDPILVRGGFVALSLVFGVGMFVYGVCWLLLPHPDGRIHAQEVTHGSVTAGFIGAVLTTLFGLPFSGPWGDHGPGMDWSVGPGLFTIAVIVGVIWWFKGHQNRGAGPNTVGTTAGTAATAATAASTADGTMRTVPSAGTEPGVRYAAAYEPPASTYGAPEPGAPGAPSGVVAPTGSAGSTAALRQATRPWRPLTLTTLGLALVVATLVNLGTHRWAVAGAVALAIVAIGLVLAGLAGRRGGFLVPVAVILALSSMASVTGERVDTTAENRTWTPVTLQQARDGFHVGAGESTIDLTSSALLAGATTADPIMITVDQGAGQIRVVLPADTPATVQARVGAGRIQDDIAGQERQGLGQQLTVTGTARGEPVLTVEVSLGAGQVLIGQRSPTAGPSASSSPSSSPSASLSSSIHRSSR